MARLGLQTLELLKASNLDEAKKRQITDVCINKLPNLLGRCWDINDHMQSEVVRALTAYTASKDECIRIPQFQNLELDTENFVTTAFSFLITISSELLQVFHPSLRTAIHNSKQNADKNENIYIRKNSEPSIIVKWAQDTFGNNEKITESLRADEDWISELCKTRHAFVHPGGFSGRIVLQNIAVREDGHIYPPTIARVTSEKSSESRSKGSGELVLHQELDRIRKHLLEYAEELIIFGCIAKTIKSNALTFAEIPESERNTECPVRFRLTMHQVKR